MRRSYLAALLIVVALVLWMGSHYVGPFAASEAERPATVPQAEPAKTAFKVRVREFLATERRATITARGVTEASKRVEARARTSGIIEQSPVSQGQVVAEGQLLCKLDLANRSMQKMQAEAALKSAELTFNASKKLSKKDFVSEQKVLDDKAKLDGAKAALEQIEWDIGWTEIKSPVAGVLVDKPAELGGLMAPGGLCATISVLDPLLVTAQVSERLIPYVREGMTAKAKLATGEEVDGTITLISRTADLATRTFRVELTVANLASSIREGVTAEIALESPPVFAHLVPGSVLMLDDSGRFGIRLMEGQSTSRFTPVTVIAQERDGAWVTGLPPKAMVVTVGQDYIKDGEVVEAVVDVAEAKP